MLRMVPYNVGRPQMKHFALVQANHQCAPDTNNCSYHLEVSYQSLYVHRLLPEIEVNFRCTVSGTMTNFGSQLPEKNRKDECGYWDNVVKVDRISRRCISEANVVKTRNSEPIDNQETQFVNEEK